MIAPDEVLRLVRQWVMRAEEDLLTAQHTLTLGENCPFSTPEAEEAVACAQRVRAAARGLMPPAAIEDVP